MGFDVSWKLSVWLFPPGYRNAPPPVLSSLENTTRFTLGLSDPVAPPPEASRDRSKGDLLQEQRKTAMESAANNLPTVIPEVVIGPNPFKSNGRDRPMFRDGNPSLEAFAMDSLLMPAGMTE